MELSPVVDKFLHFVVGLAVGFGFWWLLERQASRGSQFINPICYLLMLLWGASGLFFFRILHLPILSHQLFYMAFPDWDIPISRLPGLGFLMHRSWLFHSVIISTAILSICTVLIIQGNMNHTRWQSNLLHWCRDGAIGLSVGICAHLIWDFLLSSTKTGFRIHGWSSSASLIWFLLNLLIGLGLPFLIVKLLDTPLRSGSQQ
jgi:hypothetical protein